MSMSVPMCHIKTLPSIRDSPSCNNWGKAKVAEKPQNNRQIKNHTSKYQALQHYFLALLSFTSLITMICLCLVSIGSANTCIECAMMLLHIILGFFLTMGASFQGLHALLVMHPCFSCVELPLSPFSLCSPCHQCNGMHA
jgi:hypothetical protein